MAGSQFCRRSIACIAAGFALSFFALADHARAQDAGVMTGPAPSCQFDNGSMSPQCCEMGVFDTIKASIFCNQDPNTWRPLCFDTLFSEGWNEAWVSSPNGSGGAPRQGWINAVDGNMYRLSFFTFSTGFNDPPDHDAYLGAYTLLTPLSRRLMLITNIPFALRNNAASGLPIEDPTQPGVSTVSTSTFGDISFTPRVLLHETQDFSLTAEVAVVIPTGNKPLAGNSLLVPAVGFWHNICGGWVVRGGLGISIPTQGDGADNLISQLAIGQTLTPHDTPLLGDFTWYVSAVLGTPLSGGGDSTMALTPGIRTHLGCDFYFLAGMPIPVTESRVADLGLIFWFMKAW